MSFPLLAVFSSRSDYWSQRICLSLISSQFTFTHMMTSSNGNFFALLAIWAGNSPVTGEFPSQRPVTRSFDVFLNLRLNKRLNKQSWGWWFETPLCSLWRHCNDWRQYAASARTCFVIDIEPKIKLETTKFKTLLTFYFPLIFARYMPIC